MGDTGRIRDNGRAGASGRPPHGGAKPAPDARSALNLRLALAIFGLVAFAALTVGLLWAGQPAYAVITGVFTAIAAVNIGVVQRRRVQRRRDEPGVGHSLFE
jgi:Family of unknown function (DUF6343)